GSRDRDRRPRRARRSRRRFPAASLGARAHRVRPERDRVDPLLRPGHAALAPDTRGTRETALRVLADCRTADDDPPVPRDLSLARRNDGLDELLPLLA